MFFLAIAIIIRVIIVLTPLEEFVSRHVCFNEEQFPFADNFLDQSTSSSTSSTNLLSWLPIQIPTVNTPSSTTSISPLQIPGTSIPSPNSSPSPLSSPQLDSPIHRSHIDSLPSFSSSTNFSILSLPYCIPCLESHSYGSQSSSHDFLWQG